MTYEEILKNATPRPWSGMEVYPDSHFMRTNEQATADHALTKLAANSHEAFVEALTGLTHGHCPSCGCDLWNTAGCPTCSRLRAAHSLLVSVGAATPRKAVPFLPADKVNIENAMTNTRAALRDLVEALDELDEADCHIPVEPRKMARQRVGMARDVAALALMEGGKWIAVNWEPNDIPCAPLDADTCGECDQ